VASVANFLPAAIDGAFVETKANLELYNLIWLMDTGFW